MTFADFALSPPLQQVLAELGLTTPTPIQVQSIPVLLAGRDLVGQSQTGSGKTAAFSLPLLERISLTPRRVQALVLCPTRELCTQVAGELRRFGRKLPGLQVLVVAGGQPVRPQMNALEKGAHIVVGSPGRVLDLLGRGAFRTSAIVTVVLDEADRMLDMGFRDDLRSILGQTPPTRQTVLFSATFPPTIDALSKDLQKTPVRVTVTSTAAPPDIRQLLFTAEAPTRFALILRLLREFQPASALVFCNLKATVTELAKMLRAEGVDADGLQGDLEQDARDLAMAKFRNGSTRVLVATDVAARGLDVEAVDAVFNLDWPNTAETYTHRIGRTGRAGRSGLAVTFAGSAEAARIDAAAKELGATLVRATPAPLGAPIALPARMETLVIAAGRKDKMRPGDILGALTGDAGGLAATDVGKIEIHDRHAFVAVAKTVAAVAFERLREGRIKGRRHHVERAR